MTVIDTCIHHRFAAIGDVVDYLPENWRGYVQGPSRDRPLFSLVPNVRYPNPVGDDLQSAVPAGGDPPGSSLEMLRAQVLDAYDVDRALLVHDRAMFIPGHPNPIVAAPLCAALNDWTVDRWLAADERLYGVVLVPTQTPDQAAAEIRRMGEHRRMAGVLTAIGAAGKLLGHPIYDPIHRAAADFALPLIIHRGGDACADQVPGVAVAGGAPSTFAEYSTIAPVAVMSHVISLITNGVFGRYPQLRVYVVGCGLAWVPGLLQRLEHSWRANRRELPWMTEPPLDVFLRHFRVSTYGFEFDAQPEMMGRLLTANPDLEDVLCFGSGYPSWDTTEPDRLAGRLPAAWHTRVLYENAADWFRWDAPVPATGARAT